MSQVLRTFSAASMTMLAVQALGGCSSARPNQQAVAAYYDYDFTASRESVRGDAELKNDEQIILNNVRLGVASLADGDLDEAERALGRSFNLLSTAGLNEDRTVGAVLVNEGVRIWKGEPFEQALAYTHTATLYAVKGDWENCRAAAANSLFRLTDFGGRKNAEELTRGAAEDDDYLETGYKAVDTNFALGFLLQGIGSTLSGASGGESQLDAAEQINPPLKTTVARLKSGEYDTLFIIDYGKGPVKTAYGPDEALVKFVPRDSDGTAAAVTADGESMGRYPPACDVNEMSIDHRWNNLEDIRHAKSVIGDVLVMGGAAAIAVGANERSAEAAFAGLGAVVVGLLTKSGARADTRYMELNPASVYVVPLMLGDVRDVELRIEKDPGATIRLKDFQPGRPGTPRAVYLRLVGSSAGPPPNWLAAGRPRFGNDHTGVRPGDYPWILGGADVSTPTHATLDAYQAGGHLTDYTVADLLALYDAEGILIGSGMENRPDYKKNPSFRHILEGGIGLFTPAPDTIGYKRLMHGRHGRYEPKSDLVRNARTNVRVPDADLLHGEPPDRETEP